jgi:protein required for attachment to host cells
MATKTQNKGHVQWIVIADHVEARIWARRDGEALHLVESLQHPAGHLREQDLVSDEPGRMTARGRGHTQTMKQRGSARQTEQAHFAAAIGEHLARALHQGLYDELALVAAPRWLGELREHLDRSVRTHVVAEVHHSLMRDRVEDVVARIDASRQPRPLA